MTRSLPLISLCCFGGITGFQAPFLLAQEPSPYPDPDSSMLRISVVAGQGGVNTLKTKSAVQPIVEVRGANDQPLPAAFVTFNAPDSNPGVVFSNGARSQSLVSEMDGRATVRGMQPVGLGQFQLTVTAAYGPRFATAVINQTNLLHAAAVSPRGGQSLSTAGRTTENANQRTGMSVRKKYGIIGGIAIAAAAGIAVAVSRGKSSSSTSTVGGAGTPTVGAPH